MARAPDPAVSVCFSVKIDDHDLGDFTSCEGLSMEVQVEQREEGGNHFFVHQLPGRIKFANIKLTRPINKDSGKVAAWFATMASEWKRSTAEIVARTSNGKKVAQWGLMGVIPVRWTGPSLNVDSPKVATETLELAHHGFLEPGASDFELDLDLGLEAEVAF